MQGPVQKAVKMQLFISWQGLRTSVSLLALASAPYRLNPSVPPPPGPAIQLKGVASLRSTSALASKTLLKYILNDDLSGSERVKSSSTSYQVPVENRPGLPLSQFFVASAYHCKQWHQPLVRFAMRGVEVCVTDSLPKLPCCQAASGS
jgi:hypothetical protein